MADAAYRFQIYSTDGTTVETTFNTSQIENWEEVGGQEVRPLLGRAEARPWAIDVADISTAVMSILSDSSGRMDQISRLVDFATNYDSSGFVTRATGRIADVILNPSIGSFRFVMEDENLIARRSLIFQSSTTVYLVPSGLRNEWAGFKATPTADARLVNRTGNLTFVQLEGAYPISIPALRLLRNDYKTASAGLNFSNTTLGNFTNLRFQSSSGADYEVWGFGLQSVVTPWSQLAFLEREIADILPLKFWIVDPSTTLGTSTDIGQVWSTASKVLRGVFLHLGSTQPASEAMPLHLGTSDGIHPFQLVKDIYDGNWGESAIRYDSTALTNLINNKSFPVVWFRITEPQIMQEWLEDHIYGPFGVVPFVNAAGRVEPQIVTMPTSDIADVPNLYVFQSSSLREPHPSWAHTKRDLATVLRYHYQYGNGISNLRAAEQRLEVPADHIDVFEGVREYEHDRAGILGRHVVDFRFDGFLHQQGYTPGSDFFSIQRNEVFDRYGDGPIYGECYAMTSGTSDVSAGDFAFIELDTFPNPAIQGRGDNRLVQIISRRDSRMGPIFDWVDAGASGQSLTAPTLSSASSSTGDPYHVQVITVSNVTTDGAFVLESARSGSTVTSGSTLWTPRFTTDSSGTFNVSGLPSGSTHWYRARNTKYQRIRSPWAYTTAGVATQELTGPSALTATGITSKSARLEWSNSTASTGYELEIFARTTTESSGSTGGTPNSSDSTAILQPGITNYVLRDLTSGTTYKTYVRYRDRFGGFSPSTGLVFPTLTSTALTAETMYDIYFLYGSDSTASSSLF